MGGSLPTSRDASFDTPLAYVRTDGDDHDDDHDDRDDDHDDDHDDHDDLRTWSGDHFLRRESKPADTASKPGHEYLSSATSNAECMYFSFSTAVFLFAVLCISCL